MAVETKRGATVFSDVELLYRSSSTVMGAWMWRNHVQWVAGKAMELAAKYGADIETAYCAALLHDLGDSRYERDYPDFESWSWETGKEILKKAGFRKHERDNILEAVRTHSCHPDQLPTAIEGQVLATADALWHLQTSFFPVICYMNRPEGKNSYSEWQEWFHEKIDRDYNVKICFEDEKAAVAEDYQALMKVFGSHPLE